MQSNIEMYNGVFSKVFGLTSDDLGNDPSMMSVDSWDSMAHMELIANLEAEFGIMLSPLQIIEISSYGTGLRVLADCGIVFD